MEKTGKSMRMPNVDKSFHIKFQYPRSFSFLSYCAYTHTHTHTHTHSSFFSFFDISRSSVDGGYADTFARNTGYNEVGELNNIIMLYPQIEADIFKGNSRGCWDWWGYEDDDLADHDFGESKKFKSLLSFNT